MVQKTIGTVTGRITVPNIKQSKIDETIKILRRTVDVSNITVIPAKANMNTLVFDVKYGPVAGGWQSDVVRYVRNALVKSGSTAVASMSNYRRESTPRFF